MGSMRSEALIRLPFAAFALACASHAAATPQSAGSNAPPQPAASGSQAGTQAGAQAGAQAGSQAGTTGVAPSGAQSGTAPSSAAVTAPSDEAVPNAPAGAPEARPDDFDYQLGAGYIHQFSATIDNGAKMSADRFYASFSSRMVKTDDFSLSLAMGYEFDWYHWKGTSSLGTNDPFGSVNLFALQLRGRWQIAPEWALGVGGIFGAAGETSADAGDSIYGGGIASIAWTPSRDLMLGVGVLGVTQLEDDPLVIPIPVVHWKFADEWVLSTIRRPPASPFVGIDVAWEPASSPLDASIGVAWQSRRFRLGPNTAANLNNGVGEDVSLAMLASVGWDMCPNARLTMVGGFNFYEKIEVENSVGRQIRNVEMDPSAMLGVFLTVQF